MTIKNNQLDDFMESLLKVNKLPDVEVISIIKQGESVTLATVNPNPLEILNVLVSGILSIINGIHDHELTIVVLASLIADTTLNISDTVLEELKTKITELRKELIKVPTLKVLQ